MRTSISRRRFLGHGIGLGSLLLAACGTRDSVGGVLVPTPAIPDDDDHGPPVLDPVEASPGSSTARNTPEGSVQSIDGPVCAATADNIEGPFYKSGAPSRATLVGERDRGERLVLTGSVRSTECKPLPEAVLDIWHADWRGDYDNNGFTYRGTLATDARGRFTLRTIIPGRYLNGRRYRPAHIHVKLRARGHATLTTQLYFDGDPYIEGDPFVVSSLVMPHERDGAVRRAAFDFVLA